MHPIVPYARTAYAQGWAASGGPLTDRVRAGCLAAIHLAVTHADDPHVLEATLHLGRLEGTWAAVYQRREQVHTDNQVEILAAFTALGLRTQTRDIITTARHRAGLTSEAVGDGARSWFTTLIRNLFHHRVTADAWHRLSTTLRTALNRSRAEGQAAAMAVAADRQSIIGFRFDLAFEDAYRALEHASTLSGMADVDAWLNRVLGDTADEVGARLATLTRGGATYEEMADAVGGLLDGTRTQSIRTIIDLLTSRAMSQGAIDLYRSEGVQFVDFLTAGDARVCPRCSDLEAKNPYAVGDAPLSGQHPWCRCAVVARDVLSPSLMGRYTDTEPQPAPT